MKSIKNFIFTILLISCSGQSLKNVQCMEFYDVPGVEWLSVEKKEQYHKIISKLQHNEFALSEIQITVSKNKLFEQLHSLGFIREDSYVTENETVKINEMGEKIPMINFKHKDGSLVRVKPMQDMSNKFHPYPHYILTIVDKSCDGGFDCETLKLGRFGFIFPKHPRDFKEGASQQDINCWGRATHIRLMNN